MQPHCIKLGSTRTQSGDLLLNMQGLQGEMIHNHLTWVERQRVNKGSRNLLRRSLVPQREVIGVEHPFPVFGCQEVSWSRQGTGGDTDDAGRISAHARAAFTHADYLLVRKFVGNNKQVNSGQSRSCAQVGYLHPFIRVPTEHDKH